jgi:methionine-rich copper-binding protein CopC
MKTLSLPAFLAAIAFVTPAMAHAFLLHANPGAGAIITVAPKEISLEFTERLEPAFSGAGVTDTTGHNMEAVPVAVTGVSMHVSLKPLVPGSYRVSWHAVSVDAHRTEGAYSFTVKP